MSGRLRVQRRDDGITVLTFADPERRNRMDDTLTGEWTTALAGLAGDPDLRVVVLAGSGSTFLSGADLGDLRDLSGTGGTDRTDAGAARTRLAAFYDAWLAVRELPVPTVAAMTGHAIGAGLLLAIACDLRFAAEESRYGLPFVRLGLHPGEGATALVPEAVGLQRATDLLLTGRTVDGRQAAEYGLALEAVPAGDVLERALANAGNIASAAPIAVRLTRQALAAHHLDLAAALRWELMAQPLTIATGDFRTGLAAAAAHRPPVFAGR